MAQLKLILLLALSGLQSDARKTTVERVVFVVVTAFSDEVVANNLDLLKKLEEVA